MSILLLAIFVEAGSLVNRCLSDAKFLLPGSLTSPFVGIAITNLAGLFRRRFNQAALGALWRDEPAHLCAMSMTSIPLLILAEALGPILLVIGLQRFVITVFATLFVFRLMGRSYDAGVTRAGFAGLGLNTISPT